MNAIGTVLSENNGEVRTDTSLTAITETDFGYTRRGQTGADVEVIGGEHLSNYFGIFLASIF